MPNKFNMNSYTNIYNDMKNSVESKTGINNWNSDSVIRSIIEPLGAELARVNNQTAAILESMSLSTAEAGDLDNIGRSYGCDRIGVKRARTESLDSNFYFYTMSGTFGDINNGNDIIVKKGTTIRVRSPFEEFLSYTLLEDAFLSAGESRAFAAIAASSVGEASNVSAHSLINHNFKGYASYGSNALKCENRLPITNGRDLELDEDYRYRIYNKYATSFSLNQESITIKGLEIPGVFVQKFAKNWLGYGRSAVFLFGGNKEINQSTVRSYQTKMNNSLGVYSDIVALPGIRVTLDLDLTVWVNRSLTEKEEISLRNDIYKNASNYLIENIEESSISLIGIVNRISDNVAVLSGISSRSDRSKVIEAAYLRKSYGGSTVSSSERVKIVQPTYSLEPNEFVTLGNINIKIESV